ncbi:hypothetical protein Val02_17090 [Virgisporangium aliadipatigenens]|uniref:Protein-glutamine gamma-glutamyltransferase-like C-terminal domain-containing protein n=1 Tax=Virgisporangium aliadipatigenens TaxID=741659 RepID=A0A8J3YII7_9ACTN|nr:DUF4129 domain-containing protein [Virgisporangium aliadipatigenens]GIJ44823.1 hypothetical protein Val02_17090 [Virgisporangium aliadipatigenens]
MRRWLPLLAVAALLAAALFAAAYSEPQFDVRDLPGTEQSQPPPAVSPGAEPSFLTPPSAAPEPQTIQIEIPGWVNGVLGVACALVTALLLGYLLWFVLRDTIQAKGRPIRVEPGAPPPPAVHAEVAAAVDAGLAALADGDSDARAAVIACWVRMEQAASEAGTPREPSDAPGDYVIRLLSTQAVSRDVLDRFAWVYRQARYSIGPVDDRMRQTAISALRQLRAELTGPAVSASAQ